MRTILPLAAILMATSQLLGDPPEALYVFPAGGQRGTTVDVRVGGLFLYQRCGFELLGAGVAAPNQLTRTKTVWFEGPVLPLTDSQQAEDYPKDMAGRLQIAADAPLGPRPWRVWTAEGATASLPFIVGELPEIIEEEIAGDPAPVPVKMPVTINGRIFPREDIDIWTVEAQQGQTITCDVHAARLEMPLDARLEVLDPQGRRIAESDDGGSSDPFLQFTASVTGTYQIRIHDIEFKGSQRHVYRLTVTADPWVERVYPLGGRRGSTGKFELLGEVVKIAIPPDASRSYGHRVARNDQSTNEFFLDVDDLPEHLEAEPNNDPGNVPTINLPAMLNGRVDRPGDVDCWNIALKKGEVQELELRARRLGSPLQGVVTVHDTNGKELARGDVANADPMVRFTAPADGTYTVRVQDRFRSRGSSAHAYRLRIAPPPAPDFSLQLARDAVNVPRGGQGKLRITAERRGGFMDTINVTVDGLPAGVTVAPAAIPANQVTTEITLKAEAVARIQASRLTVRGTAKIGDREVSQTASSAPLRGLTPPAQHDTVLLAVTVPVPFKVVGEYDMQWAGRGATLKRRYRIERNGYYGPLEITLADRQMRHLQGVTGPTATIPAGVNEFEYAVQLAPWMEIGRTCRACVMATGVIKDADGGEHSVSFSSVNQNEQMVAVVEASRLGIETDRGSLAAVPGQSVELPVRVSRAKSVQGPVKVELLVPGHIQGVTAEPVIVADGQTTATLVLRFEKELRGPVNMPVVLRATGMDKHGPVIAETTLALQP